MKTELNAPASGEVVVQPILLIIDSDMVDSGITIGEPQKFEAVRFRNGELEPFMEKLSLKPKMGLGIRSRMVKGTDL